MTHMNNIDIIQLDEVAGSTVLAGGTEGLAAQKEVTTKLAQRRSKLCCIDFENVDCATASFLREAVFGTRDAMRRTGSSTPLILTNASLVVQEEILLVSRSLGTSVVHATRSDDRFSNPSILGELDSAQLETLELILKLGEATATDLSIENPSVKPTAWNNRLAALVNRGVLTEGRRERHKVYRPVVKGLSYGS